MPKWNPIDEPMVHYLNDYLSRLRLLTDPFCHTAIINQQVNQLFGMTAAMTYFYSDPSFTERLQQQLGVLSELRFENSRCKLTSHAIDFIVFLNAYKQEQEEHHD